MSDDIEYLDEEISDGRASCEANGSQDGNGSATSLQNPRPSAAALGGHKIPLTCDECGHRFEVSPEIAEAMQAWQEEAGDPICCSDCSGEPEIW